MNKKKLVVNADDFGYCKCRNAGILDCSRGKGGLVSSVSVLVTHPFCEADHNLSVGLHVNLTEGKPLSANCKTLVAENGEMLGKFPFRNSCHGLDKGEIALEIAAQIDCFKQRYGKLPTHADGHQHIHTLPFVAPIFAQTLEKYGIWNTRISKQLVSHLDYIPKKLADFFSVVSLESENAKVSDWYRCFSNFMNF